MTALARRDVLARMGGMLVAGGSVDRAFAKDFAGTLRPKEADAVLAHPVGSGNLWLQRPDGEEIMSRFRTDATYDRSQVLLLSWFMRDVADHGHAVWMEPRLFDLIAGVQAGMSAVHGAPVPLVVTSGYRTPAHNARIETAARNSMHLYGYAADLKAPGYSPRAIALAASFYGQGGIGLYDDFTHLDVWKVRHWNGPPRPSVPGQPAPPPPDKAPT